MTAPHTERNVIGDVLDVLATNGYSLLRGKTRCCGARLDLGASVIICELPPSHGGDHKANVQW